VKFDTGRVYRGSPKTGTFALALI